MNDRNVISDYKASVDGDIYNFVLDVMAGRDVLPLTVGFVTEKMGKRIEELTGLSVPGNRIVIEVVSDSSKKRNVIITAYLKKREIQDTI